MRREQMNPTSFHPEADRIEDQAAVWAARLRGGSMTDADRSLLANWLAGDPEHVAILARYRELSARLDLGFGAAADPRVTQRRRWRSVGVILAAAAAVVITALWFTGRPREFSTTIGERHLAALADGSRIELNAQTRLTVQFGRHERRVELTRGEALFTVAKDPERPFVVTTPAGVVRVTGTVFNVRAARDAHVEVTVLEGHVRVQPAAANEAASLVPGRQASLTSAHVDVHPLAGETTQDVIAWRQGQTVFSDTPLREVMERFAAYSTCAITVAPEVADLRIGGRYSLDDLDGVLGAMERALPVRVERGAAGAVTILPANAR
jgi:transmembrane sensor